MKKSAERIFVPFADFLFFKNFFISFGDEFFFQKLQIQFRIKNVP